MMDSPLAHEKLVQATLIESWVLLRVCLFVHYKGDDGKLQLRRKCSEIRSALIQEFDLQTTESSRSSIPL